MTKCVAKLIEEMASDFITGTCQLTPKSCSIASDHMHDLNVLSYPPAGIYSILCGSQAEFYIRPINRCVADIDLLACETDRMAFSDDSPVLPSDISGLADTVLCMQIDSCNGFPCFVRLRPLGEMKYNWKHKGYRFKQRIHADSSISIHRAILDGDKEYLSFRRPKPTFPHVVCGPAIKSSEVTHRGIEVDEVYSVFCPQWPKEANSWPIRPRKYGWPTIGTISEVVQNGCHVVYVQHRSCRDDIYQWRLSFSVAEVILLQSWTQVQQIVYHLLRFFAKRELIQKDCPKEDEVLCSYHLKTLMLWTCEKMSPEWWNSSPVIVICCELMKKLSVWLKKRHYPNYFIPEANLFYEPSSSTMFYETERRLNEFCKSGILSHWFVENYIQPILRTTFTCLKTRKVIPEFMDYLLRLLEYRKTSVPQSLDFVFSHQTFDCNVTCRRVIKSKKISGLRAKLNLGQSVSILPSKMPTGTAYLPTTEKSLCFKNHATLMYILHTAYGLRYKEISWDGSLFVELVNAISMQPNIIRSKYHNFPKMDPEQSSWFQFLRAQDLMKLLTESNSRPEFQLLSLMSKEFLRKALEYDDSKNSGIAPAALAYLAALHFASSEYQQAIHFCSAVLVDDTSQKDKETLNAGCLLFIDDIASIVGLCVLQKKVTDNNLHYINMRLYLDLRLSPEVIAFYLAVSSAERISSHLELYRKLPDFYFPMDKHVKALIKQEIINPTKSDPQTRQSVYGRTDFLTETESTVVNPSIVKETVIDVLMQIALENMKSFYNMIREDFGIQCNTVDCYCASYLYKCCHYEEVWYLCDRILRGPELNNVAKKFAFANVLLIPPFDSFFDRDLQSLLGFQTLFYLLSPRNDDLLKYKGVRDSTFEHWFAISVYPKRCPLSVFLFLDYSVKYHYFLGRHFLARYLKLRCLIDCCHSISEVMLEFKKLKPFLSFEKIICCFLEQKLRQIQKVADAKYSTRLSIFTGNKT